MFVHELYFVVLLIVTPALSNPNCNILKNVSNSDKFELATQWKYINFTWPSSEKYQDAISSKLYIPGNNVILGVKYYKDKFYFALPKIKPGSPVTIAYISKQQTEPDPLLTPFPDWSTHLSNNCEEILQNLQSMEIDQDGIMWVIDGRRVDATSKKCPPKIVLLDLNQNGRKVHSYVVPDEVCSHETCSMNDVVLDNVDGGFAYITDSSFTDPGLIIYSRKENTAWKVRHNSMFAEEAAIYFTTHGISQSNRNNVNGIALAQKKPHRLLYYTALSAFTLYSIDSATLQNKNLTTSISVDKHINNVGKKLAQSSGMIVDTEGQLFYGLVAEDTILRWNTTKPFCTQEIIEKNSELMPWPDSYTFDETGYLYLFSSNVDRFAAGNLSMNENNFKMSKLFTGTCSYIFS